MKRYLIVALACLLTAPAFAKTATTKAGYSACTSEESLDNLIDFSNKDQLDKIQDYLDQKTCITMKDGLVVEVTQEAGWFDNVVGFEVEDLKLWTIEAGLDYNIKTEKPETEPMPEQTESSLTNQIKPHLKLWAPDAVSLSDGALVVTLPQDQITDEVFISVLGSGVCVSAWEEKWEEDIKSIAILNRHNKQGYVFEGGHKECTELGELTGKASRLFILGKSHLN